MQGKKETRAYIANGAALCASFFLIRVVAYGAGLAHLWTLRRYWVAPGVPVLRRWHGCALPEHCPWGSS